MPRTCFVIMPFSTSASCTEDQWTWIFESVFKASVEGAGLDYECRRSVATRGNIIAAILQDLNDAYVVLADLTDRNANVFYELGVRHSLKDRTIILAQRREDIPFDLQAYAYHVYDWKTQEECNALAKKLQQLLVDVDTNPDKPDNPVSDSLRRTSRAVPEPQSIPVAPEEIASTQPLAGPASEGLDAAAFARRLASAGRAQSISTVLRLTRAELVPLMRKTVATLNQRQGPGQVQADQIAALAMEYIASVEPLTQKVEEFVLASIEARWSPGVQMGLRLAGDLISLSERRTDGQTIRFAQGAPALLAWRLLILGGAKALADEALDMLGMILVGPIEVEDQSGRFSNRPFLQRRDLFYPEAFLGHADRVIPDYIAQLWKNHPHVHRFFSFEEDYHLTVAKFLMVVALAAPASKSGSPLYPGYRLLPQARRAMSSLCSRLASSDEYLEGLARAIGESVGQFRQSWSERASSANAAELGSRYWVDDVRFPDPMGADVLLY